MNVTRSIIRGFSLILLPLMLALGAMSGAGAVGPQLRPFVEVDSERVHLGDLFDFAGAFADVPVMYAPPPGEQTTLTLGQIEAMVATSGMAWEPVIPFATVVVTRAHRLLDHNEIAERLQEALHRSGVPGPLTIDFSGAALLIKVPRGRLVELRFESVEHNPATGRFSAMLVVDAGPGFSQRTNLFGRAYVTRRVPTVRTRMKAEEVIRDSDIVWVDWRTDELPDGVITDAEALIGQSPIRAIQPGKPLARDDVGPPILIQRGAVVTMHYRSRNMHLVAMGRAQEAGAMNSVIRVQNAASRIVVDAVVNGENRVAVQTAQTLADSARR